MATHSSTADAHGQHGKKEGHEQSAKSAGKILGLPKRLAILGAGLSGGILLLALVCWWLFPGESTEAIHLANAVKLLEEGHFEEATELLQPLIESQFLDDEAPGRMAYAQGLLGYQEARNSEKEMELPRLASAIAFFAGCSIPRARDQKEPDLAECHGSIALPHGCHRRSPHLAGSALDHRKLFSTPVCRYALRARSFFGRYQSCRTTSPILCCGSSFITAPQ